MREVALQERPGVPLRTPCSSSPARIRAIPALKTSVRLLLAATALPVGVALLVPGAPAFAQALITQPALPLLNGAPASPPPPIPPLVVPAPGSVAAGSPPAAPDAQPTATSATPAAQPPVATLPPPPVAPGMPPIAFPAQPASLASVAAAPTPLPPASGQPASRPRTASRVSAILLDQANYWSAQGRPELSQ